jgi:hypothetical protein
VTRLSESEIADIIDQWTHDKFHVASKAVPLAVRLATELQASRQQLGRIVGTVRTYCNVPPQVRGEAYRDMAETLAWIDGERDDLCGWPACYERMKSERDAAVKLAEWYGLLIKARENDVLADMPPPQEYDERGQPIETPELRAAILKALEPQPGE